MTLDELRAAMDAASVAMALTDAGGQLLITAPRGVLTPALRQAIADRKSELLADLLRVRIIAAVTVDPTSFDRAEYDRLWTLYESKEPEPHNGTRAA